MSARCKTSYNSGRCFPRKFLWTIFSLRTLDLLGLGVVTVFVCLVNMFIL
jgi:hypothetical protein